MHPPTGRSGRAPGTRIPNARTWLAAACIATALPLGTLDAQPISPPDGPLPEFIQDIMRRDPHAFTFKRSLVAHTQRLRENRRLIDEGLLSTEGKTPEEVQQLTTVTGTVKVPVLLAKYSDTGADPYPAANLQTELFDGPWPTGTMTEFYDEISYGNLNVQGTVYPWKTVAHDDDYYTGASCGLDTDAHTDELITETVAANDGAVNFGQYDNDGPDHVPNSGDDDGYVDFIAIVHPEIGGECGFSCGSHNIWSHRWVLSGWSSAYTTNDAKSGGGFIKIDDYVIMPALSCSSSMIEIGVFCHEFGHAFGLPDLYDTYTSGSGCSGGNSEGAGWWELMAAGNWNSPARPAHMSAWSKAFLGWVTPGVVAFDLHAWPLQSASAVPAAYKLWTSGDPTSEYFLVEYRTATGFDDQIEAPGVLIWHVDEEDLASCLLFNSCQENECHKLLDLECEDQSGADHIENADGLDSAANRGDAGDPFCNGDTFNGATSPSSDGYDGSNTNVAVTNIANCGGASVRLDLLVGEDAQDIDLCMRDCGSDPCTEPSPCDVFWASPEVYIDNNEDGLIDPPAEGIENKLWSRVRNVGTSNATDVDVSFYFADPTLGLLFPSTGDLIGTDNVPLISGASSEVAGVIWDIPLPPPDISHYCIGVIATNASDGQTDEFAPNDDNVAQINIQELYAKAGDEVPPGPGRYAPVGGTAESVVTFETTRTVMVCNPFRTSCNFQIRIGSPPQFNDALIPSDWTVGLEYTQVFLRSRECRPLRVHVKDSHPVHGDRCVVPLTLLCDTEPAGGTILVFEIDNVQPPKPCDDFKVVHEVPPGGDSDPQARAIRVEWSESFADDLGFPERVERWRIYRGNNPNFVPGPGNMLIETCIDEDPATTLYEHFHSAPMDAADSWYKIIALDRAGNQSLPCTTQEEILTVGVGDGQTPRPPVALEVQNPFRVGSEMHFSVPSAGETNVTVFSLTGRRVRELARGVLEAGEHSLRWDGTDASGREAASGVYVVRVTSGGLQKSKRFLLMR